MRLGPEEQAPGQFAVGESLGPGRLGVIYFKVTDYGAQASSKCV